MSAKLFALIRSHPRRAALLLIALCIVAFVVWLRLGPIPAELLENRVAPSTVVVDRHGAPLYEARSGDGTRGVELRPDDLPPMLVAATIAAEDRRFWSHPGVDPIAILRAMKRNIAERKVVEGGSTISQQVAKLLIARAAPARPRGVTTKLWEAVLALRLEHRFAKREILAMYLNLAAYGNRIVGAGRASQVYFGRDVSMLTPAQTAFLAGLPQRPSAFNPYRNVSAAVARQRSVLNRMAASGALTPSQLEEARDERLTFASKGSPFRAPHFVEMVLTSLGDDRPARVETSLDAVLQEDVDGIIRSHRPGLDRHGAANVAVVVLDNANGQWLAWEGSGDYFDVHRGGAINGPTMARQPGSALKPFTYALAFEEGFTPASVLPDVPTHFPTAEAGVLYSPRNYDGRYRGPLLARRALAGSENVPAVALASEIGVPKLLRFLMRAGLSTFDRPASYYGLGVTLGNAEVRLDELVAAYAAFARGGEWREPTWRARPGAQRTTPLVSPQTAYWIGDILADPDAREYIFGRGGSLEFPFPVAVKTGTSQAYHDNWTIGYTRAVTVGVWVGNFDRTPLRDSTGVSGAGPIFHGVMLAAMRRVDPMAVSAGHGDVVSRPDGLVRHEVCSLSGMAANAWCPSRHAEWMPRGEDVPCSWHHQSDEGLLVVWPPEYRQWAGRNGLLADVRAHERTFPAARAVAVSATNAARPPLEIVNPPSGAVYLIDPTLRREFQTLALRVVSSRPTQITWQVNGQTIGRSSSEAPLMWPLAPGTHRIRAVGAGGHDAETTVVVR